MPIKNHLNTRKNLKLKGTSNEDAKDAIAEKSEYKVNNTPDNLVSLSGAIIDRGTELVVGSESAQALGRIAYKTSRDLSRNDKICSSLCLISCAAETVALACSVISIIPFRGRMYVGAKIISQSCMSFRNLCANEGC